MFLHNNKIRIIFSLYHYCFMNYPKDRIGKESSMAPVGCETNLT